MNLSIKTTLDRIENKTAVLLVRPEEISKINIPLSLLPDGSKEGDILIIDITKDEKETVESRNRASSLLDKLKKEK